MRALIATVTVTLATLVVPAVAAEDLVLSNVWARAMPPGITSASVYGTLVNDSERRITVSRFVTDIAREAHLHSTVVVDGTTRMRRHKDLIIEPGERLALEPGGLHVMLMGLDDRLEAGDSFLLSVQASNGDRSEARVVVGSVSQMESPR